VTAVWLSSYNYGNVQYTCSLTLGLTMFPALTCVPSICWQSRFICKLVDWSLRLVYLKTPCHDPCCSVMANIKLREFLLCDTVLTVAQTGKAATQANLDCDLPEVRPSVSDRCCIVVDCRTDPLHCWRCARLLCYDCADCAVSLHHAETEQQIPNPNRNAPTAKNADVLPNMH